MQQPSMMSALGGVLSLYLGISFATLFEIVEIFIDLIQNMINYIAGRPVGRKYHVMWTQSTFIINCRGWIMLFYHCIHFTLFRQLCDHISVLNWIHFTLCICWIMQLYHCTLFSYHWLNWVIQFLYTLQRGWIIELCHCKDPVDNWCHFIIKNTLIKFQCIIS